MQGRWILSLLVVLTSTHFGSGQPGQCPNLGTNVCYFTNVARLPPSSGGQYYAVGGLFNIHKRGENAFNCGSGFNPYEVMLSQAFLWSLKYWQDQVGSNTVSVGGVVFDSCDREDQMIQNLLGFEQCNLRIHGIDRHNLVGFVGTSNADVLTAASLTTDMDLTLISPMADNPLLSNHVKYKYFLRTVPSIQEDVNIMDQVLKHVQTRYVAAIYEQSEMTTFHLFNMTMADSKICITAKFSMTGEENDEQIKAFVKTSLVTLEDTRFIALFMSPEFSVRFMQQVTANPETKNMNLVFLMPALLRNAALFNGSYAVAASDAIVLERRKPAGMTTAVNAFKRYWEQLIQGNASVNIAINNPFLTEYLNKTNAAQIPRDHSALDNTIMATKAFVEGVQRAGRDICSNNDAYLCSLFFDVKSRGSNLNQKIRSSTNFFTPADTNGKFFNGNLRGGIVDYSVVRYELQGSFIPLGTYSNGNLTFSQPIRGTAPYRPGQCQDYPCLQCGELPTTTTTTTTTAAPAGGGGGAGGGAVTAAPSNKCKPDTSKYSVVYYPPGQEITGAYMQNERMDSEYATRFEVGQRWIIALGVLAGLGILSVIIFEIYILYKLLGTRMGHKWRTMWLGQLLLFGIFLCYLTLFAYLPIPTDATCGITRFGVGVSYSICFAVLLVKLMVILTSKTSESSLLPGDVESPNYLKGVYQFLMFVFVVGVQVVIDAQWLITVPPEAVKVTTINGGKAVWVCNHYTFRASASMSTMTDMSAFVRNEFENHVLSLVYIMFLILITTLLALNAHGIITNHRESVFIGIAAGFSIPIWLAWTLVGGLNKDHDYAHEFGDACIAFGLFLTATLILFAMFLPKVRQLVSMGVEGIYFEDDRDTVYAGSVIMAPPSYKSRPNSVIYVNNQGIYSEPVVLGNGDTSNYLRHPGSGNPTPASTYSAPPIFSKKADASVRGGSVLRVTDDLSGRRPLEKRRPMSEVAYGTGSRPRSHRGTLPRSHSHSSLGAL